MVTLEKFNAHYEVDIESTKEYYKRHTRIANVKMSNFEKHLPEASPALAELLNEFGVDIKYPDELCWCWRDEKGLLHYNVAYTIVGRVVKAEQYEMILQDRSTLHIVLETEYVPNEQSGPYFAFTIYNIEMPWEMEEAFQEVNVSGNNMNMGIVKKILKIIKKYWTK